MVESNSKNIRLFSINVKRDKMFELLNFDLGYNGYLGGIYELNSDAIAIVA